MQFLQSDDMKTLRVELKKFQLSNCNFLYGKIGYNPFFHLYMIDKHF